jgi:hypothetical protein
MACLFEGISPFSGLSCGYISSLNHIDGGTHTRSGCLWESSAALFMYCPGISCRCPVCRSSPPLDKLSSIYAQVRLKVVMFVWHQASEQVCSVVYLVLKYRGSITIGHTDPKYLSVHLIIHVTLGQLFTLYCYFIVLHLPSKPSYCNIIGEINSFFIVSKQPISQPIQYLQVRGLTSLISWGTRIRLRPWNCWIMGTILDIGLISFLLLNCQDSLFGYKVGQLPVRPSHVYYWASIFWSHPHN